MNFFAQFNYILYICNGIRRDTVSNLKYKIEPHIVDWKTHQKKSNSETNFTGNGGPQAFGLSLCSADYKHGKVLKSCHKEFLSNPRCGFFYFLYPTVCASKTSCCSLNPNNS